VKLTELVVDDYEVMRRTVMETVQRAGVAEFEFVEAENGEDALDKFRQSPVDLCLVDWNTPKMSGIEFVDRIRGLGPAGYIPVVMVTSEKTMGRIETAMKRGSVSECITKPFTPVDRQIKAGRLMGRIMEQRRSAPHEKKQGALSATWPQGSRSTPRRGPCPRLQHLSTAWTRCVSLRRARLVSRPYRRSSMARMLSRRISLISRS